MGLVKYKIVNLLLQLNIKIGRKLTLRMAMYEAEEYTDKNDKFDFRTIPARIKKVLIHDQDIIDKRWAECVKCEFLKSGEKMGKTYNKCTQCGCFMKIGENYIKTRLATTSCPIGKWGKEYEFIKDKNVAQVTT